MVQHHLPPDSSHALQAPQQARVGLPQKTNYFFHGDHYQVLQAPDNLTIKTNTVCLC